MNQNLKDFYGSLYRKASEDKEYCRLAAEHEALNTRLLREMEGMTDLQRDAVLDYLGLVAEIHNRLLVLASNGEKIR